MAPSFGTDGVRGLANEELTPDVAMALGRAAVDVLGAHRFIIGRDTRRSGPMLEAALVAGICGAGADVESLGVVPTPAVAWASAKRSTPGAMISASHNPFADNGIKLFAPGGLKLTDEVESRVEARYRALLENPTEAASPGWPTGGDLGTTIASDGIEGWCEMLQSSVAPDAFYSKTIVVDSANGAAFRVAPDIFRQLGATVHTMGDRPDGININADCGSTHPGALAEAVTRIGADIGLAFDGDADRLIAVDETGTVVDGDRVLAILATDWKERNRLRLDTVVVTVMTNLGFHLAMQAAGIDVVATSVGDRYVLQALDEQVLSLGGEQSGHVICRDLATTGDGVLTGIQLVDAVIRSGKPLSKLAGEIMTTVPQLLRNVTLPVRDDTLLDRLADEIAAVEAGLGADGRVLVRASGTEPLLRIMVEHLDPETAERSCTRLVDAAERLVATPN